MHLFKRQMRTAGRCLIAALALPLLWNQSPTASAALAAPSASIENKVSSDENPYAQRKDLFHKISTLTGIPWFYLAAIDQYERTLSIARPKKRPPREGLIGIYFTPLEWVGMMNPDELDRNVSSISFFGGYGRDGSGDGKADLTNDADVLYSMASHILAYGNKEDDLRIALWEHYQNSRSIERIEQFAKIYAARNTLDLSQHAFPVPVRSRYSFRSTWGAGRSWGGYRIHEGTDIFAGYGVPVRSTCYGIVENKGWNPYGGWRIGIRDTDNIYHYYAHLQGFDKNLKEGDLLTPGQVIGWVGSSGYGKPGTSGKFPPHLHYGVYRDNGLTEWSFDPYPLLKRWERSERTTNKSH
ncbi:M23 family metallopeptidase [Paenibacillus gansuensis]|uniref:M23 family metallopeptidase n=1 Tax=Paenibacillus gansuensis TaxID=306542 RepID=A0ABW5PIT7_9BACL